MNTILNSYHFADIEIPKTLNFWKDLPREIIKYIFILNRWEKIHENGQCSYPSSHTGNCVSIIKMWEDNGNIVDWNGDLARIVSDEKEFKFHKKSDYCCREFNEGGDIYSECYYLDGKEIRKIQWHNDCDVDKLSPISSIAFYGEHGDITSERCYKFVSFSIGGQLKRKSIFNGKDWVDKFY